MATVGIQLGIGIVSKIFGGMALRAKQASTESAALQQIVQGFDQAVAQIMQAVNTGQVSPAGAAQEISSVWNWYWQAITPRIQPNRNGCSSGSNCPGDARSYQSSNGAPAGYCTGTIGASCCLGCGPIRLSIDNIVDALNKGGGTATIAKVWGDRYGLQTREAYTVTFNPPSLSSGNIPGVLESIISKILPNGNPSNQIQGMTTASGAQLIPSSQQVGTLPSFGTSSGILLLGFGFLALLLVLVIRK
jgi:hypothetical protein